jgi:hypothetical protein
MSTLSTHLYELRRRLDELKPLDFQPTIIGLDVTEFPPEQQPLMLAEFEARVAELARKHYPDADKMGEFAEARIWPQSVHSNQVAEWADTVPMGEEVAA